MHSPTYRILASLLSADFARLGEEASAAINAGADGIHVDVMDNHYVPNLTLGPIGCAALRQYGITAPIDVHLMTKPVDPLIMAFAKAGATTITIHPEATDHLDRSLQLIRDQGCLAGLALNPATPIHYLTHVMDKLNSVLLMAVNPGFGGQAFIPTALDKIRQVSRFLKAHAQDIFLIVDGGVKPENIHAIAKAGATQFVVGSALFMSGDYRHNIQMLRQNLPV